MGSCRSLFLMKLFLRTRFFIIFVSSVSALFLKVYKNDKQPGSSNNVKYQTLFNFWRDVVHLKIRINIFFFSFFSKLMNIFLFPSLQSVVIMRIALLMHLCFSLIQFWHALKAGFILTWPNALHSKQISLELQQVWQKETQLE